MTIQITKPEVEALINQRLRPADLSTPKMLSGRPFSPHRQKQQRRPLMPPLRRTWLSFLRHYAA